MTFFDDDRYDWRETYFVYFESSHRPKLPEVRHALKTHTPLLEVLDSKADANENLIAITIASYEDHAALEITYREGNEILAEAKHLFHTLKKEASAKELSQLGKIVQCPTRFDVHHFEQTAATGVFNITKLPELKFPRQSTLPADSSDAFAKALATGKEKFYFDPDSYDRCRYGEAGTLSDIAEMDCEELERINPQMLVTVLEILSRLCRGVALDPASGIVLG